MDYSILASLCISGGFMEDNTVMPNTVDTIVELIIVIMICIPGLLCYASIARDISSALDTSLNHNKILVTRTDTDDPYTMTAYQVYMLGYMIDNSGPKEKSGVEFVYASNDESVYISPNTYSKNYGKRNEMITGIRQGTAAGSGLNSSLPSVAAMINSWNAGDAVTHYRGLDDATYRLKLTDGEEGYIWRVVGN